MTAEERMLYESYVAHIELREDMMRHAKDALNRVLRFRSATGIVIAAFGTLRVVALVAPTPWADWLTRHSTAIAVVLAAAWLFAAANVWCCRQRFNDSCACLMEYVNRIPCLKEHTYHQGSIVPSASEGLGMFDYLAVNRERMTARGIHH